MASITYGIFVADADVLSVLRRSIKDKVKKSGIKIVKQLNRKNRHKQTKVLRLKKAVYGAMDADDSFQLLKEWAFDQAGAKRLFSDSAVYYFQEPGKIVKKEKKVVRMKYATINGAYYFRILMTSVI